MSESFQNIVYECSRDNASVKIDEAEWINEFSGGIEMNPGDTLRVLGSFIQEKAGGDTIEVTDESFIFTHQPYITAETIMTPGLDYQITLGSIAEPVFSTDACGVEPPGYTQQLTTDQNSLATLDNVVKTLSPRISDWILTTTAGLYGEASLGLMNGMNQQDQQKYDGDRSQKLGWAGDTQTETDVTKFYPTTQATETEFFPGTYNSEFNNVSIPREFHISTLCKLVRVPLFTSIAAFYNLVPAPPIDSENPPAPPPSVVKYDMEWPNKLFSLPWQTGDYVATYYISGYDSSGLRSNPANPANPRGLNEPVTNNGNTDRYGYPRYAAGPQSVIGKVLSVRGHTLNDIDNSTLFINTYETITLPNGTSAPSTPGGNQYGEMECYIWDFVNPAAVKSRNEIFYYPDNVTFTVNRHGSAEFENGYSNYPNNNRLNGAVIGGLYNYENQLQTNRVQQMRAYQMCLTDYSESPQLVPVDDPNPGRPNPNTNFDNYQTTRFPNSVESQKLYGEANTGLSFLWSGCGNNYTPFQYDADTRENGTPDTGNTNEVIEAGRRDQFASWTCKPTPNDYVYLAQPFQTRVCANNFYDGNFPSPEYTKKAQSYMVLNDFANIGALVKVNIENDNRPHSDYVNLTNTQVPFLGIPFTNQTNQSTYTTAYQSKDTTGLQVLGIKAGEQNKTGVYSLTNQKEPWASGTGITDWSTGTNINTLTDGIVLRQGSWGLANAFNDSNCSIHIQSPKSGDVTIDFNEPNKGVWTTDLHIVKQYKTEFKLPAGSYNVSDFAVRINNQIHLSRREYEKTVGKFTTVGLRERAMASNPSIINGNFVMSFLPDLTYGFIPVTEETIGDIKDMGTTPLCHKINSIPQSTDGRDEGDALSQSGAENFQVYTFPRTDVQQNVMFRLMGGKLDYQGSVTNAVQSDIDFQKKIITNRIMECKNDSPVGVGTGTPDNRVFGPAATRILYPCRSQFNKLTVGGSCKVFFGAPNPTFSWDENQQRYYFEFLYCPLRPSEDINKQAISAGDSLPSVSVNTGGNGEITAEYGGIYITSLAGDPITRQNTYDDYYDRPDDTYYQYLNNNNNLEYKTEGREFWKRIGFSLETQSLWESFNVKNPYIFIDVENFRGRVLRNYPQIDIAINQSNQVRTQFTTVIPQNEFYISVDSDEYLADNAPSLSSSPFYLIGSDLPTKHYYGGQGNKLPIIGICGRNYARFSFVFDLSESSIQYRAEEKVTINSIHTVIYTNDYKKATNLFDSSSVIYIIERNGYAPQLPQDQLLQAVTKYAQQNQEPKIPSNYYYYQNQLKYGTVDYQDTETEVEDESTTD